MNSCTSDKIRIDENIYELSHFTPDSPELTDNVIRRFSDAFRETFSNPPYNQYIFYPSIGKPISPQEVFKTNKSYIELSTLDAFDPGRFPRNPTTNEETIFWQDPEIIFKQFKEKFKKNAYLTLIEKHGDAHIYGACFGYEASLQEAFENEEWENPFHYSGYRRSDQLRPLDHFVKRIQEEASQNTEIKNISEETRIFCLNCIFIKPELQRNKAGLLITDAFIKQIPTSLHSNMIVCEMIIGSQIYKSSVNQGMTPVRGIFTKEHENSKGEGIIMISTFEQYMKYISKNIS